MSLVTLLATLAFNAVVLAVIYLVLHRKIEKQITPEAFLEKVRSEVQAVLVELNETTDRNITLLEERVRSLQQVLKRADKKLSMLQGEVQKRRDTGEVYTHLRRAGKIVSSEPGRYNESGVTEDRSPQRPGGSAPVDGQVEGGSLSADRQAERVSPPQERKASPAGREAVDLPVEQRVVNLYNQGVAPEVIAGRLNCSIGEVELIISLYERKEWV